MNLRPPPRFKRGLSDARCRDLAERAMASDIGQEALRQGWGRGLFQFVMDWGSVPHQPETRAALHRAANDFMWDLAELRKAERPDPLTAANLRLMEKRAAAEDDLKRRFLRS